MMRRVAEYVCHEYNGYVIPITGRVLYLRVPFMTDQLPAWLLLITNLPGRNPTLRMRIWRALKAGGAGPLRDGAYLLPHSDDDRKVFEELAQEIKEGGGVAHIL